MLVRFIFSPMLLEGASEPPPGECQARSRTPPVRQRAQDAGFTQCEVESAVAFRLR
jgi:hypothetical protein